MAHDIASRLWPPSINKLIALIVGEHMRRVVLEMNIANDGPQSAAVSNIELASKRHGPNSLVSSARGMSARAFITTDYLNPQDLKGEKIFIWLSGQCRYFFFAAL